MWRLCVLLVCLYLAICCTSAVAGPIPGSAEPFVEGRANPTWAQPLATEFIKAARDYSVPVELLLTLAFFGSNFENRGAAPTIEMGYGLMALRQGAISSESLAEAAALTGLDTTVLKTDPSASIRGAAAVLDSYAKAKKINRAKGLDAWLEPVIKYAGLDDQCSEIFAWEIFGKLKAGLDYTNSTGERFSFVPQTVALDLESMAPGKIIVASPDYGPAAWDPAASCNFSTATNNKDTIVIHIAEGSYAGTISWFKNCASEVSSQYVVAYDGRITQMVRENQSAWHAGCYNSRSIGYEHEGYTAAASHPQAQYDASALLSRDVCNRWGIPKQHNTVGPGIIGHVDVTNCCCGTHTDPGNGWDWNYYIGKVNAGTGTTGSLTGTIRSLGSNLPISGATASLTGGASTTTDSSGVYTFNNINAASYTITISKVGFNTASATVTVSGGSTTTKDFSLTSPDVTQPSTPLGLAAAGSSPLQINLSWSPSTDTGGSGLAGYIVYRSDVEIGRTASISYSDIGLQPSTSYGYTLKAYDNAGNMSPASAVVWGSTLPGSAAFFTDGFELSLGGALDKNLSGGPNAAPNGSGNPWFGPNPPNLVIVGAENGITPHSGSKMVRGVVASGSVDLDQDWVNIAYRFNNGNAFTGNIALDWWFYDPLGVGGSAFKDYVALGYYNTAPGNTDYPGTGSLNSATLIQRLSLGASGATGVDTSKYQARIVGSTDGIGVGWFNTSVARSIGWHHGRITVGPSLTDGTNDISFFIDDMLHAVLQHNSAVNYDYNVIEINGMFGTQSGYFDDFTLSGFYSTSVATLGDAKAQPDGTNLTIEGNSVVTLVPASESGFIYVEAPDGSSGIRVEGSFTPPVVGSLVKVSGIIGMNTTGERVIASAKLTSGGSAVPKVRMINNRDIGGTGYAGSSNSPAGLGLSNQGLLIRAVGKVTKGGSTFWIDDGSGVDSQEPDGTRGIKVVKSGVSANLGDVVSVVGVVSAEKINEKTIRVLRGREGTNPGAPAYQDFVVLSP